MVLHIEEMRAEAALNNSRTASTLADAFKVIAESIERISERVNKILEYIDILKWS